MNETGRVTSTARKISRSWLWRLFWIFFRMNLVLLILAALGFCFYQERAALGSQCIIWYMRWISSRIVCVP